MRVAVTMGPLCLSQRKTIDFAVARTDPRGMSGSDYGFLRIAECLRDQGHDVTARVASAEAGTTWNGIKVVPPGTQLDGFDAAIAINEPDELRTVGPGAFRVLCSWLNDWSFARVGFENHVDLFCSPSAAHMAQSMTNPAWHRVEVTAEHPNGNATYKPEPSKWCAVQLGCDPHLLGPGRVDTGSVNAEGGFGGTAKIPGRVVYCSSPDRGLHLLLSQWPAIRKAVPHATLEIFYRLEPWLRSWDNTPFFPAVEPLRQRALYIEECLRRLKGHGVTVRDAVNRETIEHEMSVAECLAYPCQTTTWSEGFSCTILESCAAEACPIITDCDALGSVYAAIDPVAMQGEWLPVWRDRVIRALTDEAFRRDVNRRARKLGEELTWKKTTERIVELIEERRT